MDDEKNTEFNYLLNAMERAGQEAHPAKAGYAGKRKALLAHVRELERKASLWNLIESMWSFPGQTLGELVQRIAKERAAGVAGAAATLTDAQAEALIEASDGHWKEDVFCIGGPELMALLRAARGVRVTVTPSKMGMASRELERQISERAAGVKVCPGCKEEAPYCGCVSDGVQGSAE